jgi:3-keto-L-gulonate-6-phosphate decarboxylase
VINHKIFSGKKKSLKILTEMVIKIHKSKDKQCNGQNKKKNNAMAKIKRQTMQWPK